MEISFDREIPNGVVTDRDNVIIALVSPKKITFAPGFKAYFYRSDPFPTAKKIEVCLQDEEVKPYE